MGRGSEPFLDQLEIVGEAIALEVFRVAVPAESDVGVIGNLHNGSDDWQWRSFLAMNLQPNLLSVVGTEGPHCVERAADLLDRFFVRHAVR